MSRLQSVSDRLDVALGDSATGGAGALLPRLNELSAELCATRGNSTVLQMLEESPQSLIFGQPKAAPGPENLVLPRRRPREKNHENACRSPASMSSAARRVVARRLCDQPGNGRSLAVYDFGLPSARNGGEGEWPRIALEVVAPPWFDALNVDYRLAYDDPLKQREYSQSLGRCARCAAGAKIAAATRHGDFERQRRGQLPVALRIAGVFAGGH